MVVLQTPRRKSHTHTTPMLCLKTPDPENVKTRNLYSPRHHFQSNWNDLREVASSALIRRCPEHGPSLVRTAGAAAGRVCRDGAFQVVRSTRVDVLSVDILGAGAVGGSVLATSIFLLEAV